MATDPFGAVGKAVKTQANKAQASLIAGAQASVEKFVGDTLNTGVGFIDSTIKNVTSEIFGALGFAKLARSINLPSAETGKVDSKVGAGFAQSAKDADFKRIWESQQAFHADYQVWKEWGYLPRDFN
mgnify:CR=1 FL=1